MFTNDGESGDIHGARRGDVFTKISDPTERPNSYNEIACMDFTNPQMIAVFFRKGTVNMRSGLGDGERLTKGTRPWDAMISGMCGSKSN